MSYLSRSDKRSKRKNKNLMLNSLILVVLALISVVGYQIVFGDKQQAATSAKKEVSQSDEKENSIIKEETNEEKTPEEGEEDSVETSDESTTDTQVDDIETEIEIEENDQLEDQEIITESTNDPNVENSYVNPNWEPIGTNQTGEHVSSYEIESTDWKEKEKAIAYGANLSEDNLIVWYIENGGAPNKAIGTVTSSDEQEIYRVYIEWINGEGWTPTKVDRLLENDKKQTAEE
ncbi:YrrS family protein [Bacillus spongiae]|uniref:YrrS family protein n=1 Tax=Bacillus spongiae TaxID=2683610 RepID=A0ABU8H965_9BACI